MRWYAPFAGALLWWQSTLLVNIGVVARPDALRYQRAIAVAAPGTGMACLTLDATVLSHTANAAHSDMRLFGRLPGEAESEVAFALTESGPEPVADTAAMPQHVSVDGSQLSFDLLMPARPFSEVRLRLGLKNFVATASVTGFDRQGHRADLGRVALFDLSEQHMGHWSSLLLGESSWPVLHVLLDVRTPAGVPFRGLVAGMVQGAEVPPSRLRQTRYTPTVSTDQLQQDGTLSLATLQAPAHVPVERVRFEFPRGYSGNFAREVAVSALTHGAPGTDTEALDAGVISHVDYPSGDPRLYPIALREDAVNATLGATLAGAATVLVAIYNEGQAPLPVQRVVLEMRERRLCFFADREASYTLRYGDPSLSAPSYDEATLTVPAVPLAASMGPEARNPQYRPRREAQGSHARYPELYWVVVLLCAGTMGGMALHLVQHRRT